MKRLFTFTLIAIWAIAALAACSRTKSAASPTPDVQATINAALAATSTAQATIDASVKATVAAMPTPTVPASVSTMSEEELAALIDQAVVEAVSTTQQCSTATTQATADDTLTQEEVDSVQVYVVDAEQAIAYAEALLTAYYGTYGELAAETLAILQAIEQDLAALAETTAAINAGLQEIEQLLAQGMALTEDSIAKLETAAQNAGAKAAQLQTQSQGWVKSLQAEVNTRAANALAVQPNQLAADRQSALQSAFEYLDASRKVMADNKISPGELAEIAQLGANAAANLNAQGGPQLQKLSGSINQLTDQMARGQLARAQAGLGNLEAALGARPSRPTRP